MKVITLSVGVFNVCKYDTFDNCTKRSGGIGTYIIARFLYFMSNVTVLLKEMMIV